VALLEVEELVGFDLGLWMRARAKGAKAGLATGDTGRASARTGQRACSTIIQSASSTQIVALPSAQAAHA
jgi:hypothetical protein